MTFNDHSNLKGYHAELSPSNYHWVNYDLDKMVRTYRNRREAARGTELHDIACRLIKMGIKLPRAEKTLNMFVNDAISWRMSPEQVLFYSPRAFGTTDAISVKKDLLRIHDLKNGIIPGNMTQLEVYAALYCLEYGRKPSDLTILMRIYQDDLVHELEADPTWIAQIMETIVLFDKKIQELEMEERWLS